METKRKVNAQRLYDRVFKILEELGEIEAEYINGTLPELKEQNDKTRTHLWVSMDSIEEFLNNVK